MRKIALIAMLAIVGAMVPMATASSTPTPGSLDGVGTLMVVNAFNSFVDGSSKAVDLWLKIDGNWQKLALSGTDQEEFQVPHGTTQFQICSQGSTDHNCNGAPTLEGGPYSQGSINVESNDIVNFLITRNPQAAPTGVWFQENNTDVTDYDQAELTIFNSTTKQVDVCVGDNHVITNLGSLGKQVAEFESKDGALRDVKIAVGGFPGCNALPTATELGFPAGSNTVTNLTVNANCTSDCGYQIFPGAKPGPSDAQVQAFCAVVLDAANIRPWLQALFAEVEVGNEDTYPEPDHVKEVITKIAEILDNGNEAAPSDIRPAWLTSTAAFVETGRLAAIGYDISQLPQDDLRSLVDSIDLPAADDEAEAAATAEITAWVTTNCFGAVEAQPTFTG